MCANVLDSHKLTLAQRSRHAAGKDQHVRWGDGLEATRACDKQLGFDLGSNLVSESCRIDKEHLDNLTVVTWDDCCIICGAY